MRICDLKQKEVINIKDCKGRMIAIIVPGPGCVWGFLGHEKEYVIPFCDIKQIGDDIILVELREKKE